MPYELGGGGGGSSSGGDAWTVTNQTGAYTASDNDSVYADGSSAAVPVTLPPVSAGTSIRVTGIDDTNALTVLRDDDTAETIDGVDEDITLAAGQTVTLEGRNGTDWRLVEGYLWSEQGTVTLVAGAATIDTGITSTSAAFEADVGVQDPDADIDVVARVFWDDTAGTHQVDVLEDSTNVGTPTVNYVIKRTRA